MTALSPARARRVFLTLTVTRWFPVGLVVGLMVLWPLERGLTVAEALLAFSCMGFVTFALELPTSGFADAFGRKPLLVVAAGVQALAALVLLLAHSFWAFALFGALTGLFRALDSGPLEAWFVDAVHEEEPDAEIAPVLARQGTLLGGSIATAALLSGGLVWWHPLKDQPALLLPVLMHLLLSILHVVATAALLREPGRPASGSEARRALRATPQVIGSCVSLLRRNRVLRWLVVVELFWALAMVVFESFLPIRLAELLGSEQEAGALVGPVAAAGWATFAAGAAFAGVLTSRIGAARAAMVVRVLNGLGAVVMGVVAGPAALIVAYLVTYGLHGSGNPPHATLLHRQADRSNRSTVLSINSMTMFAGFSLALPLLGMLAEGASTQVAMMSAGAVSMLGALCYLPARRQEQEAGAAHSSAVDGPPVVGHP